MRLDKVSGRARYSCDVQLPGQLCGAVLRSPHPHARVAKVDVSRLKGLPGPRGERTVPLERFMTLPNEARRVETALEPNELLLGVRLTPHPPGTRSIYLKAMDRSAFSFAMVGVAAVLRVAHGKVAHARIVLSGVGPIPWRVPQAEALLDGSPATAERFEAAAGAALQGATPLRHNGYKVPLARALLKKALGNLAS